MKEQLRVSYFMMMTFRERASLEDFPRLQIQQVLGKLLPFSVLAWCMRQGGYGLSGNVLRKARVTSNMLDCAIIDNEKDGKRRHTS
jgi:hypothetical protein